MREWMQVHFIIRREGEPLYAEITAEVNTHDLRREGPFRRALTKAITEWIRVSEDGKEAWEYSGRDFNVGDLSSYENDPVLEKQMKDQGIRRLQVGTIGDESACSDWVFDTVLVDETVLDVEEEDDRPNRSKCNECAHLVADHDEVGCHATYDTLLPQHGYECGCSVTKEDLHGKA